MAEAKTKHCRKCGQTKPSEEFPRNRRVCKVCTRARQSAWENSNREHVNERSRQWAQLNTERSVAIKRRHYLANRDRLIQKARQSFRDDPQKSRDRARKQYWSNPEARREYSRQHRRDTIELQRVYAKNRKARKRAKPDTWTFDQSELAIAYWSNACAVCSAVFASRSECHWDHWIPLIEESSPGTVAGNMVPLCPTCNLTKNRTMPAVWIRRRLGEPAATERLAAIEAYLGSVNSTQ